MTQIIQEPNGFRILTITKDNNLGSRSQDHIQHVQQLGTTDRRPLHNARALAEYFFSGFQKNRISTEFSQSRKCHRRHGTAAGRGIVKDLLVAGNQRLMVIGGVKETPIPWIAKLLDDDLTKPHRLVNPVFIEARLVERDQGIGDIGIVVQKTIHLGRACPPAVKESSIRAAHRLQHETGSTGRRLEVLLVIQDACRAGHAVDHQAIPACQHLVVLARPDPLVADLQQAGTGLHQFLSQLFCIPSLLSSGLLNRAR